MGVHGLVHLDMVFTGLGHFLDHYPIWTTYYCRQLKWSDWSSSNGLWTALLTVLVSLLYDVEDPLYSKLQLTFGGCPVIRSWSKVFLPLFNIQIIFWFSLRFCSSYQFLSCFSVTPFSNLIFKKLFILIYSDKTWAISSFKVSTIFLSLFHLISDQFPWF